MTATLDDMERSARDFLQRNDGAESLDPVAYAVWGEGAPQAQNVLRLVKRVRNLEGQTTLLRAELSVCRCKHARTMIVRDGIAVCHACLLPPRTP